MAGGVPYLNPGSVDPTASAPPFSAAPTSPIVANPTKPLVATPPRDNMRLDGVANRGVGTYGQGVMARAEAQRAETAQIEARAAAPGTVPQPPRQSALQRYGNLHASDFSGPDDPRLLEVYREDKVAGETFERQINQALSDSGINAHVSADIKTPKSIYGKLAKKASEGRDYSLSNLTDLSRARINVDSNNLSDAANIDGVLRHRFHLPEDSEESPNNLQRFLHEADPKNGYARSHLILHDNGGNAFELQIGTSDMTDFIEKPVGKINLHDAIYKGSSFGIDVPKPLQNEYSDLLKDVSAHNRSGQSISSDDALNEHIAAFQRKAYEILPDTLKTPGNVARGAPPAPQGGSPAAGSAAPASEAVPAAATESPTTTVEASNALSTAGRVARVAGGGIGVAGGAVQTLSGVSELRAGHTVDGAADVSGGVANTVSGGALLAGAGALAAGAGGVGALIDGGRDIYNGISTGNHEQVGVGGVKTVAGGLLVAGAATGNPVLIAAGAATYLGAVAYENRDAIEAAAVNTYHKASDAVGEAASATRAAVGGAVDSVTDTVDGAVTKLKSLF